MKHWLLSLSLSLSLSIQAKWYCNDPAHSSVIPSTKCGGDTTSTSLDLGRRKWQEMCLMCAWRAMVCVCVCVCVCTSLWFFMDNANIIILTDYLKIIITIIIMIIVIILIIIIIIIIIIITITITITIAYGYNTALNHVILIKRYKHCNAMKFAYSSSLHFYHITHYHVLSRIITHYHALSRIITHYHVLSHKTHDFPQVSQNCG